MQKKKKKKQQKKLATHGMAGVVVNGVANMATVVVGVVMACVVSELFSI